MKKNEIIKKVTGVYPVFNRVNGQGVALWCPPLANESKEGWNKAVELAGKRARFWPAWAKESSGLSEKELDDLG